MTSDPAPISSYVDPVRGAVNRVSVGVNNFWDMFSNSRNTVARPIQPIWQSFTYSPPGNTDSVTMTQPLTKIRVSEGAYEARKAALLLLN